MKKELMVWFVRIYTETPPYTCSRDDLISLVFMLTFRKVQRINNCLKYNRGTTWQWGFTMKNIIFFKVHTRVVWNIFHRKCSHEHETPKDKVFTGIFFSLVIRSLVYTLGVLSFVIMFVLCEVHGSTIKDSKL
jgi:hypothetical protein